MECVICGDSIIHAHMGVNSCRACSVFYKRTLEAKRKLKCKHSKDCEELKTSCRKCRFLRCQKIVEQAGLGSFVVEKESESSAVDIENGPTPTSRAFLDHTSFYDCPPSTSKTPLLDILKNGYSLMCMIRKSGEAATRIECDKSLEIRVRNMTLVPATYSHIIPHIKICQQAMKAFAGHVFEDFRALDEESQDFIIDASFAILNPIDTVYRWNEHLDGNVEIRLPGYSTYLRLSKLENLFENCPDQVDSVALLSEFRSNADFYGRAFRKDFMRLDPDNTEFLALLGLAVWGDATASISQRLQETASRNRQRITRELHIYYREKGVTDYSSRIGHLFCLLFNLQSLVIKKSENFHLYRLMNLFKGYFDKNGK